MKNADYSEIGFRIMQLRNQQNISRERLADMANISQKFLYETPLYNFLKNKITHKALSNV